jgi:5-methylcytosine-specific restriction enzyme subunit McrC
VTELFLAEGGPPVVVRLEDASGEALARSRVVDAVRLGGGDWQVSARQLVGVVLIGDSMVWVQPKVDIRQIFFLLGYAHRPGWSDDTAPMADVDQLLPALAQAFVEQAERALDTGLLHGYRDVEESLPVMRGRLRSQEQLTRRFGIALPLLVRFDDHVVDVPENQILLAAAELLLRVQGVPIAARGRLRGLRQVLADVTVLAPGRPLPRWVPSRLNERYHVALWLAELLLRNNSVDHARGDVRVSGFLVDMAKVFEDFLSAALTRALLHRGGWCRPQDRHHLDTHGEIAMRPDLVWYLGGAPAAVFDAKYKAEKPAGFPDADLYQMLAYCTALALRDGHLVYAKGNEARRSHTVRNAGVVIHAHVLDLDASATSLLAAVGDLAATIEPEIREGASL